MKIKTIMVLLAIICCTTSNTKAQIIITDTYSFDPSSLTLDWGKVLPGESLSSKSFTVICGKLNSTVGIFCSTCPTNLSCKGGGYTNKSASFYISGTAQSDPGVHTQEIKISISKPNIPVPMPLCTVTIKYTVTSDPPSIPQDLIATNITRTGLDLSWSASTDDVAVTGYNVYKNGTNDKSVTAISTSYKSGLTPNVEYTFNVSAYDAIPNTSALSSTLHVITSPLALSLSSDISSSNVTYDAVAFNQVTLSTGFTFTAKDNTYSFSAKIRAGSQQWTETTKSSIISTKENSNEANYSDEKSEPVNLGLSVSLYPNPTANKLYINGISNANIHVFDLSGRMALHFTNVNGSIDVSVLNPGTYIIKLNNEKNNYVQKFVKY